MPCRRLSGDYYYCCRYRGRRVRAVLALQTHDALTLQPSPFVRIWKNGRSLHQQFTRHCLPDQSCNQLCLNWFGSQARKYFCI